MPNFNGFVGQASAVKIVKSQIAGARALSIAFPHSLFIGNSGSGKTYLAEAIAADFGTQLVEASGYESIESILAKIRTLNFGDFLFVDEAHNLTQKSQELFFAVIDHQRLPDWCVTTPAPDQEELLKVKQFTIMLATDQPSRLQNAMRKRFVLSIGLGCYSLAELKEIVDVQASERILLSPQAAKRIAEISRGLPRKIRHHLELIRLHFFASKDKQIRLGDIEEYQREFGIFDNGLTRSDFQYLTHLDEFGTASIQTLAASIGHEPAWVQQEIEGYLLLMRLMLIGPGGRKLTVKGKEFLADSKSKESNNEQNKCWTSADRDPKDLL